MRCPGQSRRILSYAADQPLPKLGAIVKGRFRVALADGSARSVPQSLSDATLRAAITRNGGEQLPREWDE